MAGIKERRQERRQHTWLLLLLPEFDSDKKIQTGNMKRNATEVLKNEVETVQLSRQPLEPRTLQTIQPLSLSLVLLNMFNAHLHAYQP